MTSQNHSPILYRTVEHLSQRRISEKVAILHQSAKLQAEERVRRQSAKIIQTLRRAEAKVPYYRDLFRRIGFEPARLERDFAYFQEIPYLTKETIQAEPKRFLSDDADSRFLHVRKTAGSTGLSLSVFYDQESLDWTAAVNRYVHELTGRTLRKREIHLSSELSFMPISFKDQVREKVKCLAMKRTNVYTQALDGHHIQKLYSQIQSAQAYLVQGHPSTLYALALHVRDSKIPVKKLFDVFESTGESLDREKVAVIENYLGCNVYNRFGNAEFGVVAHSLDNFGELRVIDDSVYAENFTYGGGIPEIVLTGLLNPMMPLIRYRTGDIGEVIEKDHVPYIIGLHGRIHDVIEANGKKFPTHYIKDYLERVGGLDEFQFVTGKDGKTRLNLVLNQPQMKDLIFAKARELLGDSMRIEFVSLNSLVRVGWRDKFRYLVRE